MPRKDICDDAFDIGIYNPRAGMILACAFVALAGYFHYFPPLAIAPMKPLVVVAMLGIGAFALLGSIRGYFRLQARAARLSAQKSLDDLRSLSWREFEEVIADAYRRKGFQVEERGGTGDGGIDLVLISPAKLKHPVQIKQWRSWSVGAPRIREFVGAVAYDSELSNGIYVTVGSYSRDAADLVARHHIELIDGPTLLDLLGH